MLSEQQVEYITTRVDAFVRNPGLYYNLPTAEHRRLTDELNHSAIGEIVEGIPPIADAICGANRRYFWQKTQRGIFQVITNRAVNAVESVVFDP